MVKGFYSHEDFLVRVYSKVLWEYSFTGKVLILGMGSCYVPRNIKADQVTIVDNSIDVINAFGHYKQDHWELVLEDAYKYVPKERFDYIFVDIWDNVQDYSTVNELVERYKQYGDVVTYLPQIVRKHTIPPKKS